MKNPFQRSAIDCSIYDDRVHSKVREKILKIFDEAEGVYSLAVLGDPGTGKTSLLKYIKNKLEKQDNVICIIVNGNRILSFNEVAYNIIQVVIDTLSSPSRKHLQQIARHVYNETFPFLNLDQRFDVETICRKYQDHCLQFIVDIDILRALLWTLDEISDHNKIDNTMRPVAIKWLKGLDLNEDEAKILKLTRQSSEIRKNETSSLNRLISILLIIAKYKKIIFAFDEIESNVMHPSGLERKRVIADFIKSLHDNFPEFSTDTQYPFLILSFLLPDTWLTLDKSGGQQATRVRLCSYSEFQGKPLELDGRLSVSQSLELVEFWLKETSDDQTRDPYYPFLKSDIENFAQAGSRTPRDLWQWCAANWRLPEEDTLEALFKHNLLNQDNLTLINDESKVADVLYQTFDHLIGHTIARATIISIDRMPPKEKFQLIVTVFDGLTGKMVKTGLGICLKNANAAKAMLNRLLVCDQCGLDRGYFLRPLKLYLNPQGVASNLLNKLKAKPGGKGIFYNEKDVDELHALNEAIKSIYRKDKAFKKTKSLNQDDENFRRQVLTKNELIQQIITNP